MDGSLTHGSDSVYTTRTGRDGKPLMNRFPLFLRSSLISPPLHSVFNMMS